MPKRACRTSKPSSARARDSTQHRLDDAPLNQPERLCSVLHLRELANRKDFTPGRGGIEAEGLFDRRRFIEPLQRDQGTFALHREARIARALTDVLLRPGHDASTAHLDEMGHEIV